MPSTNASTILTTLREQQSSHPLSILHLAEPILESQHQQSQPTNPADSFARQSNASSEDPSPLTPSALALDLSHYRDLFSKLRFSYLEQVTKEKYLRSIVGDPPVLVTPAENAALEEKLGAMKRELKAKKEENERLVEEMGEIARDVARQYEEVNGGMETLEAVPPEIERMQEEVNALKQELAERREALGASGSDDPRQNMGLDATQTALDEQKAKNAELDKEIERLQRQMPGKMRECEKAERELEELERRRNEVTRQAREVKRIREEGGRDHMGERGRWYRAQETVMTGLLGIEQAS